MTILHRCRTMMVIICAVALTACATFSRKPSDVETPTSFQAEPVPMATLVANYGKAERNAWIEANLVRIDAAYYASEKRLQDKRTRLNITTSTAALIFNIASSLTPSAGVKANYVAANSLATGAATIADREQFLEQTVATLISAMRARREQAFAVVRVGMTKEKDEYLLSDAHRDLLAYSAAGTLQQGMKFVVETTEKQADETVKEAKDKVAKAVEYTEEERQLTNCISRSLETREVEELPMLREAALAHGVQISGRESLSDTVNKISDSMFNRPPESQRGLYAIMSKKGLLLDPCPEY